MCAVRFRNPKRIRYSVIEAGAAACEAEIDLASTRGSLCHEKSYPQERDVSGTVPPASAFLCVSAASTLPGVVNIPQVVEYAKTLPGVTLCGAKPVHLFPGHTGHHEGGH